MSAGDREQAELLDAYRVMLARDPAAATPGGLEPEVAAVAKVLARHYAPAPDAAFAAALRRRLLAGASQGQGKEATMTHRQDPTSRIGANDRPPSDVRDLPTPRADRRPSSVILTGANALASAAVIAVLVLALVLVLRGPGRSADPAAAPTQQAASSVCPPSLLPATPATPPNRPIPATPTGREASLFVACAFERDPGLRRAEEVGLVQHPNASQTVNGFTLTVQRFYADANRIVVGYTIAAADWIADDHRLDPAQATLTDSAGRTYSRCRSLRPASAKRARTAHARPRTPRLLRHGRGRRGRRRPLAAPLHHHPEAVGGVVLAQHPGGVARPRLDDDDVLASGQIGGELRLETRLPRRQRGNPLARGLELLRAEGARRLVVEHVGRDSERDRRILAAEGEGQDGPDRNSQRFGGWRDGNPGRVTVRHPVVVTLACRPPERTGPAGARLTAIGERARRRGRDGRVAQGGDGLRQIGRGRRIPHGRRGGRQLARQYIAARRGRRPHRWGAVHGLGRHGHRRGWRVHAAAATALRRAAPGERHGQDGNQGGADER